MGAGIISHKQQGGVHVAHPPDDGIRGQSSPRTAHHEARRQEQVDQAGEHDQHPVAFPAPNTDIVAQSPTMPQTVSATPANTSTGSALGTGMASFALSLVISVLISGHVAGAPMKFPTVAAST